MKIEWEEIARRGKNHALLVIEEVCVVYEENLLAKHLPGLKIKYFRQFDGGRWFGKKDVENYVNALREIETKSPGTLLKQAEYYTGLLVDKRKWIDKLMKLNLSEMSNQELLHLYKENNEANKEFLSMAYHYHMLNKFCPDLLTLRIAEKVKDLHKQTEISTILFSLDKPSEMRREKESIIKIAIFLQDKNYSLEDKIIEKMVDDHLNKFAHLGMYYFWRKPYSRADIKKRLKVSVKKDLSGEIRDLEEQRLVGKKTVKIINELNLDEDTQLLIKTIRSYAFAANYFDETYNYMTSGMLGFWAEIGKRFGLTFEQSVSMRAKETLAILETGSITEDFKKELQDRFIDHAIILENGDTKVLSGEKLKEYYKQEAEEEKDYSKIKELRGQSASPGIVRGKARLVLAIDEIAKVKKDEIMVAAATAPSFVPAMEKASAIVTNEGGLLSHAAIVSRELGIPCVVGTKIATKVLKDGDLVEVDASKGIVRKL